MSKFIRSRWVIFPILVVLFFIFVHIRSGQGVIFFGDSNVSFWKNNHYLLKPYIWQDNDYGFFAPLNVINLPIQVVFRILTIFFDINKLSIFYFYGTIACLFASTIFLIKAINSQAEVIDQLIIAIFTISNPIFAGIILSQTDIAISLCFVYMFLGYIFICVKNKFVGIKDVLVLSILSLFINTYFYNTILLFTSLAIYLIFFKTNILIKNIRKILLYIMVFFLINIFWIIVPCRQIFSTNQQFVSFYSENSALGVLQASSSQVRNFSPFMFSNSFIKDENNPAGFFSNPVIVVSTFAFTLYILYKVLIPKSSLPRNEKNTILFFVLLGLIFFALSLGARNPFGNVFMVLWSYLPGFSIFRSIFKFQFVVNVSFIILLIYVLKREGSRKIKYILLVLSLLLSSTFFFNRYFVSLTKPYKIPEYYSQFEEYDKKNKLIGSGRIFPTLYFGSAFLYTPFKWNTNNFDSANILRYFTPGTSVFTPFGAKEIDAVIEQQLCNEEFNTLRDVNLLKKVFSILNIRNLIVQQDIRYKNSSCFKNVDGLTKYTIGELEDYAANNNQSYQHVYTPRDILVTDKLLSSISEILETTNTLSPTIVFSQQNDKNTLGRLSNFSRRANVSIEFKKIDPTKYRVVLHNISADVPLVLSESFHRDWKVFPQKYSRNKIDIDQLQYITYIDNYDDVNRMNKDQIIKYVNNGTLSLNNLSLKNYTIDFISKDFNNSMQNNNLANGSIFETSLLKPISESDHFEINGYANGWIIDPKDICDGKELCIKNADGSYDISLVIEFWPQRLLYLGIIISVVTIIIVIVLSKFEKNKIPL